jgi:hypothetical protein
MTMKAEVHTVDPFLQINYLIGCLVHASTVWTLDYLRPFFRVPTWGWTDASKIRHVISISNLSRNRDCSKTRTILGLCASCNWNTLTFFDFDLSLKCLWIEFVPGLDFEMIF